MKNIFYFYNINSIGGVESMFYYLAKKYKNKDITILYTFGDKKQIERLQKFVRVEKYNGEHLKCERAFFNYNTSIINNIDAKEYILIVHADYIDLGIEPLVHPKITKYIGVSQKACDSYSKLTGLPCELCYNPILIDKPKQIKPKLKLISATRLTKEKGKDRLIKLGEMLNEAGVNYEWTIFTNDTNAINNPNIIYKKPTLNIIDYINNADYLVQLSDNEGYCYSVVEALCCGVPVIVTPCPVFNEIGLKDKENCYYVDFEMNNVPIKDIVNNKLKFTYIPKEDNWENLLADGESTYQKDLHTMIEVKATYLYKEKHFIDKELNYEPKEGEFWYTNKYRAEMLKDKGFVTFTGNQKLDK